jgi:hypothetical protein
MPLVYTYALEISQLCPWRRGRARQRRTAAGGGKHVALECDWAHHGPIGSCCVDGGGSGERQRRGCGGTLAGAWLLARVEAGEFNKRPWELLCGLGNRLEALAGGGSEQKCQLTEAVAAMAGGGR